MDDIPHLHDGHLTGIRLLSKSATIYLRTIDGDDYELLLEGLEALHLEDVREGNIISHVDIVARRTPSPMVGLERLFGPPHPSAAPEYHEAHRAIMAKQVSRIKSGEICLVVIVPSYGADMLATCQNATFRTARD